MKAWIGCVVFAAILLLTSGCTLIGIGAGKVLIDDPNAQFRAVAWDSIAYIKHHREISLTLTNGDFVIGRFMGADTLPQDSYKKVYQQARSVQNGESGLPDYGDSVLFERKSGTPVYALFGGFALNKFVLRPFGVSEMAYLPIGNVETLQDLSGKPFDMNRIRLMMESRQLPLNFRYVLQTGTDSISVAPETVSSACLRPRNTKYWLLLGAIGLVIDAAITAAILENAAEHSLVDLGTY